MESFGERASEDALVNQRAKGILFETDQVLLGSNAGHKLLVSSTSLLLSCALLNSSPLKLLLAAGLCSLQSLGLNEFSITNFLKFLLLKLHNPEFFLLKS